MPLTPPSPWTDEELQASRTTAEHLARQQRREAGPRAFAQMCAELEPQVVRGLELSNNLRQITGDVFRADPAIWQMFRYVCAPPVSEEDFWTLVAGAKFRRVSPAIADDVAAALVDVVDPVRFPWVEQHRDPQPHELATAVLATTCMWTAQRLATQSRGLASRRQEAAVAAALQSVGLNPDPRRTQVQFPDEMARGTYSQERKLRNAKCDVPARLADGRLLAIECKVSNGPKNGWKRLNREVGGKAQYWREEFGTQVLTAVVLDGVFDLAALRAAITGGVAVFWGHDLDRLTRFVAAAR